MSDDSFNHDMYMEAVEATYARIQSEGDVQLNVEVAKGCPALIGNLLRCSADKCAPLINEMVSRHIQVCIQRDGKEYHPNGVKRPCELTLKFPDE